MTNEKKEVVMGSTNKPLTTAKSALRLQEKARRKRAYAPAYDPIRQSTDIAEAWDIEREACTLMTPLEPLKTGSGGEVVPPVGLGLIGLELALKEPDLLNLEASVQRSNLAESAGVFELAIEAAESVKAKGSVQKMLTHQLAAAHRHSLRILGEAEGQKDKMLQCKMINTAARLMDAYAKGALTLQRLQTGASQIVQVQHVQVNGQAIIGNVGAR